VSTPADFAELYAAAWPRVFRTTYAVTGDTGLAEDAVQTAFAQAFRSWQRVSKADDPIAYVRRMAINAALSHHRKAHRRRERLTDPPDVVVQEPVDPFEHDDVWLAVRALAARQRAVVVLRYYEGLTEREIADVLGCRPGTVKSQASAALATLRQRLAEPTTIAGGI
jgi:RNA polymerase sigma-70 factor (sigma-E family)